VRSLSTRGHHLSTVLQASDVSWETHLLLPCKLRALLNDWCLPSLSVSLLSLSLFLHRKISRNGEYKDQVPVTLVSLGLGLGGLTWAPPLSTLYAVPNFPEILH
jgi:hypothetical protein